MDTTAWDSVKNTLKVVAPGLATLFLGPAGGAVTAVLSNLLLGKANATPEEINQALQTLTPEGMLKIKELELNFKIKEQENQLEELKLSNQDLANARDREITLAASGHQDRSINIITYVIIAGLFGIMMTLIISSVYRLNFNKEVLELLTLLVGGMNFAFGLIIQYKFGSSKGSKEKDDLLSYIIKKKA